MGTLVFQGASGGSTALTGSDTASTLAITAPASNGVMALQDSTTGALHVSIGTTAQRPSSPLLGDIRWNTTINAEEVWNGITWVNFANQNKMVNG